MGNKFLLDTDVFDSTGKVKPPTLPIVQFNDTANGSIPAPFIVTSISNGYAVDINPNYINYLISQVALPSLPSPTLSTGAITSSSIILNWNSVANASTYYIDKSTDGAIWSSAYTGNGLTTTITGLNPSTNYFFRLSASASGYTTSLYNTLNVSTTAVVVNTATNLLPNSYLFGTYPPYASGGNDKLYPDPIVTAPDGSSVTKITVNTDYASLILLDQYLTNITPGVYTFYADVKAGDTTTFTAIIQQVDSSNSNSTIVANGTWGLSNGTVMANDGNSVAGTPNITSLGGGWYRCSITFNCTVTCSLQINVHSIPYTIGSNYYLWRMQLNAGSTPSTYVQVG